MENKNIELLDINKEHIELVNKAIIDNKLNYTEESIDFVLNKLNKSFDNTANYSDENLKIIYMCGLEDHDRAKALKIMGELRKKGIHYRVQHAILVDKLMHDDFFMSTEALMTFLNLREWLAQGYLRRQ